MLSQYMKPEAALEELAYDLPRVRRWFMKYEQRKSSRNELYKMSDLLDQGATYTVGKPVYWESPKYGNKWQSFRIGVAADRGMSYTFVDTCYRMTDPYMVLAMPMKFRLTDGTECKGIVLFTDHLFQRMADPKRLGVNISDRLRFIQNFSAMTVNVPLEIRPPRKDSKYPQFVLRLSKTLLCGTVRFLEGGRFMAVMRTFYSDPILNKKQKKMNKSFMKYADKKYIFGAKNFINELKK